MRPLRPLRRLSGRHAGLPAGLLAALLAVSLLLGGCALRYGEGQALEREGRWEEALIAYRDAVISDPDDLEYREALERSEKVVARDNFERYKAFLAEKAFRKAYQRLLDAARQDPQLEPAQQELAKWDRVLVGGQIRAQFETAQTTITLAEQIRLVVRINTPNPGETIDAEVDIENGTFFAEDLLYNRSNELLALYSINSIGVELVFGRSRIKQFTSRDFKRFINIRTPVVDAITGTLGVQTDGPLRPISEHRALLPRVPLADAPQVPVANPRYSLRLEKDQIIVQTAPDAGRPDFTPRFIYLNKGDRRVFVDFGRYRLKLAGRGERWSLNRLRLSDEDYFAQLSRNIALQPYFFYREGVFTYVPARAG